MTATLPPGTRTTFTRLRRAAACGFLVGSSALALLFASLWALSHVVNVGGTWHWIVGLDPLRTTGVNVRSGEGVVLVSQSWMIDRDRELAWFALQRRRYKTPGKVGYVWSATVRPRPYMHPSIQLFDPGIVGLERLAMRAGFQFDSWRDDDGRVYRSWEVKFPYWPLVALTAACPAWVVARAVRTRRRRERGLCEQCGYDVRSTPDRCPECGTPVKPIAGVPLA